MRISLLGVVLRVALALAITTASCQSAVPQTPRPHSYVPPAGFVPDSITAIRIAEAVWIPIYGEDQIRRQRPFHARLANNVWTVIGSLPRGWVGGVALAEISKRDARILRVESWEVVSVRLRARASGFALRVHIRCGIAEDLWMRVRARHSSGHVRRGFIRNGVRGSAR